MTTRRCNKCMLYYPDMIWSHTVSNCPFCGASIKESGRFAYLTPEEKQAYRKINEEKEKIEKGVGKMTLSISESIKLYKKYRYNRSLLLDEKRYVMEAFWKHIEKEKEDSMSYVDWLFDYYLSKFEEVE